MPLRGQPQCQLQRAGRKVDARTRTHTHTHTHNHGASRTKEVLLASHIFTKAGLSVDICINSLPSETSAHYWKKLGEMNTSFSVAKLSKLLLPTCPVGSPCAAPNLKAHRDSLPPSHALLETFVCVITSDLYTHARYSSHSSLWPLMIRSASLKAAVALPRTVLRTAGPFRSSTSVTYLTR